MTVSEMYAKCKEIFDANIQSSKNNWEGYEYIGLRFEDKDRQVGDTCEASRNNIDREDEREFPAYGTDEYNEMELLNGTSAWDMENEKDAYQVESWNKDAECTDYFPTQHCYVIASNRLGSTSNTVIDHNEIVIENAVVIAKLF